MYLCKVVVGWKIEEISHKMRKKPPSSEQISKQALQRWPGVLDPECGLVVEEPSLGVFRNINFLTVPDLPNV